MVSFNELVSRSDIKQGLTNTGFWNDIFRMKIALADVFLTILYIWQLHAQKYKQSVFCACGLLKILDELSLKLKLTECPAYAL